MVYDHGWRWLESGRRKLYEQTETWEMLFVVIYSLLSPIEHDYRSKDAHFHTQLPQIPSSKGKACTDVQVPALLTRLDTSR